MVAPVHRVHHAYDEYVAFERTTDVKHEYLRGQIYAMAGDAGAWSSRVARGGEVAELASVGARLDVRAVYDSAAVPS